MPKCPFFKVRNIHAFTLVELLVVIVIIAILASVITASLGSARKQARDTKRVSDVKNIAQALEQYYTDKGGYPYISNGSENTDAGLCIESSTTLQSMLIPSFLASIPVDPLYNASDCSSDLNTNCHCYIYRTQGSSAKTKEYKLFSKTEAQTSAQQGVTNEGGTYYFETASPTESASTMTLSPQGSAYGNWFGYANTAPTFTRGSVAYKNDGSSVTSGTPRFETIAVGMQGVTVEEGTTNLVVNPTFASGLSGWSSNNGGYPSVTCSASVNSNLAYCKYASQSAHIVGTASLNDGIYQGTSYLTVGNTYTATVVLYIVSGQVKILRENNAGSATSQTGATGFVTLQFTFTYTNTSGAFIIYSAAGPSDFYVCAVQIEQKTYATSFAIGARAAEVLTIPTTADVLPPNNGTVELLLNVTQKMHDDATGQYYVFDHTNGAFANSIVLRRDSGKWVFFTGTASPNWSFANYSGDVSVGLHRFAMKWSSAEIALFIDGTKVANVVSPSYLATSNYSTSRLGSDASYAGFINSQISDVVISNRARTDAELQARGVLTSLPVDSSTTYKLGLNGSLN